MSTLLKVALMSGGTVALMSGGTCDSGTKVVASSMLLTDNWDLINLGQFDPIN